MIPSSFSRRNFALRLASILSGLGLTSTLLRADSPAQQDSGIQKLNYDGKPADGTQMITSLIVHNGLIYISGQGANDAGSVQQSDIESHTTKVMNNVKKLVEAGGGSMDSILQLTVYLGNLDYYDGMNKVFKTYFPHGGPARTTVAVAGVPGHSLLEINCIAAVTRR
jgi:2-iminobutanoate/2-iminopropanoate deaminase